MDSASKTIVDEEDWVVRISRILDKAQEDEIDVPVCIFNVPKSLMTNHPQSYAPQQIAIGPCNFSTPENLEMERYKVAAAKKIQRMHQNLKFHHVVEQFKQKDQYIRAYYQRYLDLNDDTLAWIMALDASFLLEFLRGYATKEGTDFIVDQSRMPYFIDYAGTRSSHNAILRDIVMLENQIPLFLLREVLVQFSSMDLVEGDKLLASMLIGFCRVISPFKVKGTYELPKALSLMKKSAHLLDFLYHTIVPNSDTNHIGVEIDEEQDQVKDGEEQTQIDVEIDKEQVQVKDGEEHSLEETKNVKKLLDMTWKALSNLNKGSVRIVKQFAKPIRVVSQLPWTSIFNFSGRTILKGPLESISLGENFDRSLFLEEINIPSVTDLSKAGVRFVPTDAGIDSIKFDAKTRTLSLPMITVDVNSEVVFRNLVAYEACNASRSLVLSRYTELMNGIVDTDEDVKLLRKRRIIVSHLKRDAAVTQLWNGMKRSTRLTNVEFLEKTIRDVNKYYDGRPNTRFKKFMTHYVFESWKFLTLFATVLMLLLMSVQAFCSVYSCPRIVNQIQSLE